MKNKLVFNVLHNGRWCVPTPFAKRAVAKCHEAMHLTTLLWCVPAFWPPSTFKPFRAMVMVPVTVGGWWRVFRDQFEVLCLGPPTDGREPWITMPQIHLHLHLHEGQAAAATAAVNSKGKACSLGARAGGNFIHLAAIAPLGESDAGQGSERGNSGGTHLFEGLATAIQRHGTAVQFSWKSRQATRQQGGGGGDGTRPWWLALLACGGAYWPLAFEPSAMPSRDPHYCGHPHCRWHPPSWGGIQNATSAHGVFP